MTTVKSELWSRLQQTSSTSPTVFSPLFLVILMNILGWFWRIHFPKKTVTKELLMWELNVKQRAAFQKVKSMNKFFLQKLGFFSLVKVSETEKSPIINK